MRVAEIMIDYRNLQHYIASIRAEPIPEEHGEEGYVLLRRCISESQAVLYQPFRARAVTPGGIPEQEKMQLRQ